jgi:thioredoxin-like negative regulator of GroEL
LPVFEKYASKNEEHFCRVEVDNMEQCESKYSIDVVPTVLFFKNAEVVKRLDGTRGEGLNEKQLLSMIDSCGLGSK